MLNLSRWSRGFKVTTASDKTMFTYFWFYEWNLFGAIEDHPHTSGKSDFDWQVATDTAAMTSENFAISAAVQDDTRSISPSPSPTHRSTPGPTSRPSFPASIRATGMSLGKTLASPTENTLERGMWARTASIDWLNARSTSTTNSDPTSTLSARTVNTSSPKSGRQLRPTRPGAQSSVNPPTTDGSPPSPGTISSPPRGTIRGIACTSPYASARSLRATRSHDEAGSSCSRARRKRHWRGVVR